MELATTIDDLFAAYGPTIRDLPSNKHRDPVERELLMRLGDPNVFREMDGLTREDTRRKP